MWMIAANIWWNHSPNRDGVLAWLSVWSEIADLHEVQLMPLPLTVSCFSNKIQIGFTFLVPTYPGSPGQKGC